MLTSGHCAGLRNQEATIKVLQNQARDAELQAKVNTAEAVQEQQANCDLNPLLHMLHRTHVFGTVLNPLGLCQQERAAAQHQAQLDASGDREADAETRTQRAKEVRVF